MCFAGIDLLSKEIIDKKVFSHIIISHIILILNVPALDLFGALNDLFQIF